MSCTIESEKFELSYFFPQLCYFPPSYTIFFFFPPVTLFSSVTGGKKEENSVTAGDYCIRFLSPQGELEFELHNCIHSDELLQLIVSSKSFNVNVKFSWGLEGEWVGMASIGKIFAESFAF